MFSQKHRELNGKHLKEKTEENKNKMNLKKKKKKKPATVGLAQLVECLFSSVFQCIVLSTG